MILEIYHDPSHALEDVLASEMFRIGGLPERY